MSLRDLITPHLTHPRTLLLADRFVAQAIYRDATRHHYLVPAPLKTPHDFWSRRSLQYLVTMKKEFQIGPYLATRLYPHLVALPETVPTAITSQKIIDLIHMKERLLQLGLDELKTPFWIDRYHYVALNFVSVPPFIPTSKVVVLEQPSTLPIHFYTAPDDYGQYHAIIHYIGHLLHQGVDINHIKIAGANEADVAVLARLASTNGWTLSSRQPQPLLSYPQGLELQSLLKTLPLHEVVALYEQRPLLHDVDIQLLTHLHLWAGQLTPAEATFPLINYLIETCSIRPVPVRNTVEVISLDEIDVYDDTLHTIVMHASEENYPVYEKDNDYIRDEERVQLGWSTSVERNKRHARAFAHLLKTTPHLYLFSSMQSGGQRLHPYSLTSIQRPVHNLEESINESTFYYSLTSLATRYAKDRYAHYHYGIPLVNATERERHSTTLLTPFDPQFKPIPRDVTDRLVGHRLRLSPTSLDTFVACQFRYLLIHRLKLISDENRLNLEIGSMAHSMLEEGFKHHQSSISYHPIRDDLTPREQALSRLFAAQLQTIYQYLSSRTAVSAFQDVAFERAIEYEYPADVRFTISGKIDRIQTYQENDTTYVVVLDYKTGNDTFDEQAFHQGLDTQLVFYLHLLTHDESLPMFEVAGFYYQPLNLKLVKRLANDQDPLPGLLKLTGITLRNVPLFQAFSGSEAMVAGVKITKDGDFASRTDKRVKSSDIISRWMTELSQRLDAAIHAIQAGDYRINPQPIQLKKGVSSSCEYCPFARICYLANSVASTMLEDDNNTNDEEEPTNG